MHNTLGKITSKIAHRLFCIVFALSAVALLPRAAKAAVTISSIERVSYVEGIGTSTISVYGGNAGNEARCTYGTGTSTDSLCDNCRLLATETTENPGDDSLLQTCNNRRINPNLQVVIYLSSDSTDGLPTITNSDGTTALTTVNTTTTLSKGSVGTIVITWQKLCEAIFLAGSNAEGTGSDCLATSTGQATGTLRIGISSSEDGDRLLNGGKDDYRSVTFTIRSVAGDTPGGTTYLSPSGYCDQGGEGICYFEVGPGDQKVAVKALQAPSTSSFPSGSNTQFRYVRFLFDQRGIDYIHMGSSYVDLTASGAGTGTASVSPKRVEGLQNDVPYYFATATVDLAGNVGYYMPHAQTCVTDSADAASGTLTCRTATPSAVVGVLSNTNCFIATAAYGGENSEGTFGPEVQILRDFRDNFLMASPLGRAIVRFYYAVSPALAETIVHRPKARAVTRAALEPIVAFASLALNRGFWVAMLAAFTVLTIAGLSIRWIKQKLKSTPARDTLILLLIAAGASALTFTLAPAHAASESRLKLSRSNAAAATASEADTSLEDLNAEIDSEQNPSTAKKTQGLDEALDEAPPEPEYPYPGATDPEFQKKKPKSTVQSSPTTPAPAPNPEPAQTARHFEGTKTPAKPTRDLPRPKAMSDEGEYYYGTIDTPESKQYGKPAKTKFSKQAGREAPQSITADGEFMYPTEKSGFSGAGGFRLGVMLPPNITNPDNGLSFKDIYGNSPLGALIFDYEYPLTRSIGRVGIKFEAGFVARQGQGRFRNASRATEIPDERFTFLMVPMAAGIMYRFQFADTQWIVPFVDGGGGYSGIVELRDDSKKPIFGGSPMAYGGGGFSFLLDYLDRKAIAQLDNDYGINHVWATAQFRQIVGLKKELDITSSMITLGLSFDY